MDAQLFAQTFSVPIEQRPLLVYSAALPFTPTSSTLHFHNNKGIPFVAGGFFLEKWAPQILLMTGHTKRVNAAAFSTAPVLSLAPSGMHPWAHLLSRHYWGMSAVFSRWHSRPMVPVLYWARMAVECFIRCRGLFATAGTHGLGHVSGVLPWGHSSCLWLNW